VSDIDDNRMFAVVVEEADRGRPTVLATVIERRGAAPREVGAKMLLWSNGATLGTVGGGCVEAEVRAAARQVLLETRAPRTIRVRLTERAQGGSGDVCGGEMEVFLDYIEPGGEHGHE
jgi:xanthine dehydrogenase accessory factor